MAEGTSDNYISPLMSYSFLYFLLVTKFHQPSIYCKLLALDYNFSLLTLLILLFDKLHFNKCSQNCDVMVETLCYIPYLVVCYCLIWKSNYIACNCKMHASLGIFWYNYMNHMYVKGHFEALRSHV